MLIDRIKSGLKLITGLDIGSSKICIVVGEVSRDGVSIISVSSVTSSGVRKGVINDIDAVANCIRKATTSAEKLIGKPINEVFAGITGTHIKSVINIGSSTIKSGVITEENVKEALEAAADIDIHRDAEMVQVLPADFIIDGQGGIMNPVGMSGNILEVKTFIFTSDMTALENLIQCCETAEIKIKDIILQPFASAEASLSSRERENGAALIDIGGGTTEISIYKYNLLKHTVILGIGGNHFTNDLSIILEIPFQEAEKIKINNGYLSPETAEEQNEIDVTVFESSKKKLYQKDISAILLARSEELLGLIRKEIDFATGSYGPIGEALLTGGASLLPGFRQLAEDILSIPVRIAYPEIVSKNFQKNTGIAAQSGILHNVVYEFNQPAYATGIGLVLYGAGRLLASEKMITTPYFSTGIASKLAEWFKNIR